MINNHNDIIRSKLSKIKDITTFIKFSLWILNDPKYGVINHTTAVNSIKAIQKVIYLYEEWLETKIIPSSNRWRKVRNLTYSCSTLSGDVASHISRLIVSDKDDNYNFIEVIIDTIVYVGYIFPISSNLISHDEIKKEQLIKLDNLINEIELYSEEDYDK